MRKFWLFTLLMGIVGSTSVCLMAENNCQKCNKPADCISGCVAWYYPASSTKPQDRWCSDAVAHSSPGKVCEAGGKDDNCVNNMNVNCAKYGHKRCPGTGAPDCTGIDHNGTLQQMGCSS